MGVIFDIEDGRKVERLISEDREQSEQRFLGLILLYSTPGFRYGVNREIFEAMIYLLSREVKLDVQTLELELRRRGRYDASTAEYLNALVKAGSWDV